MQAERLHARAERSHEALRKSLAQSGLERRYPPVSVGAHYQRAPPVLSNTLNKREAIAVLQTVTQSMNLQELKRKTPAELLALAEELEIENASTGSGSLHAGTVLRMGYRDSLDAAAVTDLALESLFEAADQDSATGGPDPVRGIYPVVALITRDGYQRLDDDELAERTQALIERRRNR